jgi:serine-type D-Ala-D-Ala carboxypeptidase (penicillin-binding protein 5/6)
VRRLASLVVAVAPVVGLAQVPVPTTTLPPPPPPKAWILVDATSGAVLDAGNARTRMAAASVSKIVTALVALERLPADATVPVSARAEGMPARKMNMKAGQVWTFNDVLHALLLVSANDAAVALAERVSGSEAAFAKEMARAADRLGMADDPLLLDASGLDDEFSHEGGNLISARDLAIATRAALTHPQIASIVALPEYRFGGGDGQAHRLVNHNRLLKTYPGAVGVKTGATKRAGRCLIAAARRGDRTLIAVVLRGVDMYGYASLLLDRGFATPVTPAEDYLPEVVTDLFPASEEVVTPPPRVAADPVATSQPWYDDVPVVAWVPIVLLTLVVLLRIRVRVRRRRRRQRLISWG